MLSNSKFCKAILLSLIAFLSIVGCVKIEDKSSTSYMIPLSTSQELSKSDVIAAHIETISTGIFMNYLGYGNAFEVNSPGKVVGQLGTLAGPHAYLWFRRNRGKDPEYLGTEEDSSANDINDQGEIIGTSLLIVEGNSQLRAFLRTDKDDMVNLGTSLVSECLQQKRFLWSTGSTPALDCRLLRQFAFLWTDQHGMVPLSTIEPFWIVIAA
jgi:probable HAF family extracellular repeat protein